MEISQVSEFNSLSLSPSLTALSLISYVCTILSLCSLCSFSSVFFLLALSSSPSIPWSLITGTYSQSAAIQLRESPGVEDHLADVLLLSQPGAPTPPNRDPPRTPPQLMNHENPLGQPKPEPVPGPNKRAMEDLEDAGAVRAGTGISKVAGQGSGGSGGGVSTYYRPTRRGSPRPSPHNHFDINEHLPWMIVLLLLLVLVVIVVCSVKRSSRVLKKGPVQDPISIMEKAIQKKPSVPRTHLKEKWTYYSNGQGKPIVSLISTRVVLAAVDPTRGH